MSLLWLVIKINKAENTGFAIDSKEQIFEESRALLNGLLVSERKRFFAGYDKKMPKTI